LEGPGKVLLHDRADEKSDETEGQPNNEIDSPEAGGVKKILMDCLKHQLSVGENVR
jgi:hypothetical protein